MGSIGNKIKKLRKLRGLSQEELGFELGVSRQTVLKWENNVMRPNAASLKMLCDFFGVSPDVILSDEVMSVEEEVFAAVQTEAEEVAPVCKAEETVPLRETEMPVRGRKYIWLSAISFALFALLTIFTLLCGFVVYSDNVGIDRTATYEFDGAVFFISLILCVACLFLMIMCIFRAIKRVNVN